MSSPLHHWVFQRLVHTRERSTPSQNRALPVPGIGVASAWCFVIRSKDLFFLLECGIIWSRFHHIAVIYISLELPAWQHTFSQIFTSFSRFYTWSGVKFQILGSHWPGHFTRWMMFLNTLTLNKTRITYSNVLFHSTKLARIPGTWCSPLGCLVQDQELDSVIPIGPFQLRKFCDKNRSGFSCI